MNSVFCIRTKTAKLTRIFVAYKFGCTVGQSEYASAVIIGIIGRGFCSGAFLPPSFTDIYPQVAFHNKSLPQGISVF